MVRCHAQDECLRAVILQRAYGTVIKRERGEVIFHPDDRCLRAGWTRWDIRTFAVRRAGLESGSVFIDRLCWE
jgi:hypothetical protein